MISWILRRRGIIYEMYVCFLSRIVAEDSFLPFLLGAASASIMNKISFVRISLGRHDGGSVRDAAELKFNDFRRGGENAVFPQIKKNNRV